MSSVAVADGCLYAVDLPGRLHCMDPVNGKVNWIFELNAETWGTPLVADGKIFIGTKKYLHVLAAGAAPKELAKIGLGSPSYGTPVAANETLFVTSERYLWAVTSDASADELE
jgi:outer membrane protein assembly factor BamB